MYDKARLVIIGAGIVGASAAYHLTRMGWRDVLVLDKGDLFENDGSTSHAPGGLRVLTPSEFFTRLGHESRQLYASLPLTQPGTPQVLTTGTLQVATTRDRFENYKRIIELGKSLGVEAHLLDPREAAERLPILDREKVVGGMFIPEGGVAKTTLITEALAREAEAAGGATFVRHAEVTDIEVRDGQVRAVVTSKPERPRIECEAALLCNNIWAPRLCQKIGVPMPLLPGQHQYVVTGPVPALSQ